MTVLAVDTSGSIPDKIRQQLATVIDSLRGFEQHFQVKAVSHIIEDVTIGELVQILNRTGGGDDWPSLVKLMEDPATPMICITDDYSTIPPHNPANTFVIDISQGINIKRLYQLLVDFALYYSGE